MEVEGHLSLSSEPHSVEPLATEPLRDAQPKEGQAPQVHISLIKLWFGDFVCVCAPTYAIHVCHGKHLEVRDNLKELDFSFYHVGPKT